ncbi:MAG: 2-dehydropantoate 2-reductase [Gammaproteobacteria bacterium]
MKAIPERPRICIIGAGAIGGFLAVRLADSGHAVSVIDRGIQLAAISEKGLHLYSSDRVSDIHVRVTASGKYDLGPQDIIMLAVKSQHIPQVANNLGTLMHDGTVIITLQNGVPWWYFQKHGGEHEGRQLDTVDPGGVISRLINPLRIIGCVVYPAAEVSSPGVIRHIEGNRLPVGELDNTGTERASRLSELFIDAGFKSPVLTDLRSEIWLKLWGTLAFNPVSMLTRATLEDICRNSYTHTLVTEMMREAEVIAGRLGIGFRVPLEKRIAGAERVGPHKTSTLQDLEAGRETEIDALLGAVIELGRITDTLTPHIDSIYAACKLLERSHDSSLQATMTSNGKSRWQEQFMNELDDT